MQKKNLSNKGFLTILVILLLIVVNAIVMFIVGKKQNQADIMEHSKEVHEVNLISEEEFKQAIKKFKDFGDIAVKDSEIMGLKQITVKSTGEVFYSNNTGSIILVGAMIDASGRNYTREAMDTAAKSRFVDISTNIDRSLAIKIGNGSHEILAFTDPDCGYCRAAEAMFKEKENEIDATRYVYFTPIDSIHPDAATKAVHVLCSENQEEELIKLMRNELTDYPNQCDKGKELLQKHREIGALLGVSGTPTFYVDGVRYVGADPAILEKVSK